MQNFDSVNHQALSMLSRSFCFQHLNPLLPQLGVIGNARVVSVCIHEQSAPELCILVEGDQYPGFYHFDELSFTPLLGAQVT